MADPSQSISELKIDRSAPSPESRSRMWLLILAGVALYGRLLGTEELTSKAI